ncbi:MAG: hypothetical protein QXG00_00845 [Candidatus Woesearchaeota archaeon]
MIGPEKYFYLCNGDVLRSIEELYDYVSIMPDFVFYHHVSKERNDFYNWIKDVFQDIGLANQIKEIINKDDFVEFFKNKKANSQNIKQIAELMEKLNETKINKEERKIIKEYKENSSKKLNEDKIYDPKDQENKRIIINNLNNQIEISKKEISDLRKKGKDVFLCQIYFDIIKAKQKIAELSLDDRDIDLLRELNDKLKQEIEYSKKNEEINIRNEIQEKVEMH